MRDCVLLAIDWNAVGSVLSGLGAIAVAWFAFKGLSAWKSQFKGTRQIELAEELLEVAYEAEEVLKYINLPQEALDRIVKRAGAGPDSTDVPEGQD